MEPVLSHSNRSAVIAFTASNSIPWYTAEQAVISSNRSWCGVRSGDYLEVDLGEKYVIAQLSTLGDQSRGQFVTSYELLSAQEKNKWTQEMAGDNKVNLGFHVAVFSLHSFYFRLEDIFRYNI